MYTLEVKKQLGNPYISQLYELYDLGLTDLNSNLRAINLAKGNIEKACNYILEGIFVEPVLDPYM
jgi:hypothetical protein